jgi:D-tyrosyl-tRNA(Tyr) deacylase
MRFVIQRVSSASVTVDEKIVGQIGKGLLVLVGLKQGDTKEEAQYLVNKAVKCRLWDDKDGKSWKCAVPDFDGEILVVSQFTLFGSLKKGNKPDFHLSMKPDEARDLYDETVEMFKKTYKPDKIQTGEFQALMQVSLTNDGPVTLQLDTDELFAAQRAHAEKFDKKGSDTKKQETKETQNGEGNPKKE